MKITLLDWRPVAYWQWDVEDDNDVCGICQTAFDAPCPACHIPGDDCPIVWGECTHVFHMHCIEKWTSTESSRGECPLDRKRWVTAAGRSDPISQTISVTHTHPHAPQHVVTPTQAVNTAATRSKPTHSRTIYLLDRGRPASISMVGHQQTHAAGPLTPAITTPANILNMPQSPPITNDPATFQSPP